MARTIGRSLYVFSIKGRWYWWLRSNNGNVLACSPAQGYSRRDTALNAASDILPSGVPTLFEMPSQIDGADNQFFQYQSRTLGEMLLAVVGKRRRKGD